MCSVPMKLWPTSSDSRRPSSSAAFAPGVKGIGPGDGESTSPTTARDLVADSRSGPCPTRAARGLPRRAPPASARAAGARCRCGCRRSVRASSWASTTAWRARSVNRSNTPGQYSHAVRTRTLGKNGPEITVVGYGAWQAGGANWGDRAPDDDVIAAMHAAGRSRARPGSTRPRCTARAAPRSSSGARSPAAATTCCSSPRWRRTTRATGSGRTRSTQLSGRPFAASAPTGSTSTRCTGQTRAIPVEETWGAMAEVVADGLAAHGSASRTSTARSSSAAGRSTRWRRCRTSSRCSAGTTLDELLPWLADRGDRLPGVLADRVRSPHRQDTRPTPRSPRTTGGATSSHPSGWPTPCRGWSGWRRIARAARRHHGPARDRLGDSTSPASRPPSAARSRPRTPAPTRRPGEIELDAADAGGGRRGVYDRRRSPSMTRARITSMIPPTTTAMPIPT